MADQRLIIDVQSDITNFKRGIAEMRDLTENYHDHEAKQNKISSQAEARMINKNALEIKKIRQKALADLDKEYKKARQKAKKNSTELQAIERSYQKKRKQLSERAEKEIQKSRENQIKQFQNKIEDRSLKSIRKIKRQTLKELKDQYKQEMRMARGNATEQEKIRSRHRKQRGRVKGAAAQEGQAGGRGGGKMKMRGGWIGLGLLAGGAAVKLFKESDAAASEFADTMTRVSTLLNDTQAKALPDAMNKLRETSKETGINIKELGDALYFTISAVPSLANNLEAAASLTDKTSKAAIGLNTDAKSLTLAVTGLGNALSMSMEDTETQAFLLDTLSGTMKAGVMSGEQLSSSIARNAPVMGVITENAKESAVAIASMSAAMTGSGISMEEAQTQIGALGKAFLDNKTRAKLMELGLEGVDKQTGKVKDWNVVFSSVNKNMDAMTQTLTRVEAKKALLLLGKTGKDNATIYENMSKSIKDSAGLSTEMFNKMAGTSERAGAILKQTWNDALISVGQFIEGSGGAISKWQLVLADVVGGIGDLFKSNKQEFQEAEAEFNKFGQIGANITQLIGQVGQSMGEVGTGITQTDALQTFEQIGVRMDDIREVSPFIAQQIANIRTEISSSTDKTADFSDKMQQVKDLLEGVETLAQANTLAASIDAQIQSADKLNDSLSENVSYWDQVGQKLKDMANMDIWEIAKTFATGGLSLFFTGADEQVAVYNRAGEDLKTMNAELELLMQKSEEVKGDAEKYREVMGQARDLSKDINELTGQQKNINDGITQRVKEQIDLRMREPGARKEAINDEKILQDILLGVNQEMAESEVFAKNVRDAIDKQLEPAKKQAELAEKMQKIKAELSSKDDESIQKARESLGALQVQNAAHKEMFNTLANKHKLQNELGTATIAYDQQRIEQLQNIVNFRTREGIAIEDSLQAELSKLKAEQESRVLAQEKAQKEQAVADLMLQQDEIKSLLNDRVKQELQGGEQTIDNRIKILNVLIEELGVRIQILQAQASMTLEETAELGNKQKAVEMAKAQIGQLKKSLKNRKQFGIVERKITGQKGKQQALYKTEADRTNSLLDLKQQELELLKAQGALSDTEFQQKSLDIVRERLAAEEKVLETMLAQGASEKDVIAQRKKVLGLKTGIAKGEQAIIKKEQERMEKIRKEQQEQALKRQKRLEDKKERQLKDRLTRESEQFEKQMDLEQEKRKAQIEEVKAAQSFAKRLNDIRDSLKDVALDIVGRSADALQGIVEKFKKPKFIESLAMEKERARAETIEKYTEMVEEQTQKLKENIKLESQLMANTTAKLGEAAKSYKEMALSEGELESRKRGLEDAISARTRLNELLELSKKQVEGTVIKSREVENKSRAKALKIWKEWAKQTTMNTAQANELLNAHGIYIDTNLKFSKRLAKAKKDIEALPKKVFEQYEAEGKVARGLTALEEREFRDLEFELGPRSDKTLFQLKQELTTVSSKLTAASQAVSKLETETSGLRKDQNTLDQSIQDSIKAEKVTATTGEKRTRMVGFETDLQVLGIEIGSVMEQIKKLQPLFKAGFEVGSVEESARLFTLTRDKLGELKELFEKSDLTVADFTMKLQIYADNIKKEYGDEIPEDIQTSLSSVETLIVELGKIEDQTERMAGIPAERLANQLIETQKAAENAMSFVESTLDQLEKEGITKAKAAEMIRILAEVEANKIILQERAKLLKKLLAMEMAKPEDKRDIKEIASLQAQIMQTEESVKQLNTLQEVDTELGNIAEKQKIINDLSEKLSEIQSTIKDNLKIESRNALDILIEKQKEQKKALDDQVAALEKIKKDSQHIIDTTEEGTKAHEGAKKALKDAKEELFEINKAEGTREQLAKAQGNERKKMAASIIDEGLALDDILTKEKGVITHLAAIGASLAEGDFAKGVQGIVNVFETTAQGITQGVDKIEGVVSSIMKGESKEIAASAAELAESAGKLLMTMGGPLGVAGAILFAGGKIAKGILHIFKAIEGEEETATDIAEKRKAKEEQIRQEYDNQLERLQDMKDLGNWRVKTVKQELAYLQRIHKQLVANSDVARDMARLSENQLINRKLELQTEIDMKKALVAEGERLMESGRKERKEFLESLGIDVGLRDTEDLLADLLGDWESTIINLGVEMEGVVGEMDFRKMFDDLAEQITQDAKDILKMRLDFVLEIDADIEVKQEAMTAVLDSALNDLSLTYADFSDGFSQASWQAIQDLGNMGEMSIKQLDEYFLRVSQLIDDPEILAAIKGYIDLRKQEVDISKNAVKNIRDEYKAQFDLFEHRKKELEKQLHLGEITDKVFGKGMREVLTDQLALEEMILDQMLEGTSSLEDQQRQMETIWDLKKDIYDFDLAAADFSRTQMEHEKTRLEHLKDIGEITEEQYRDQLLEYLNNQLDMENLILDAMNDQTTNALDIFDQRELTWDLEKQIYDLMNDQNSVQDEQLNNIRELNRERTRMIFAARAGEDIDVQGIASLETQIIDQMREAGATQEQIDAQLQTFRATFPQYQTGTVGERTKEGMHYLHDDEAVLNPGATKYFDENFPGFIDAVNTFQGDRALESIAGTLSRSQSELEVAKTINMINNNNVNLGSVNVYTQTGASPQEIAETVNQSIERKFQGQGIQLTQL
jgi:hypothetical protein